MTIRAADNEHLATVHLPGYPVENDTLWQEMKINANLMATAPDLLAALEPFVKHGPALAERLRETMAGNEGAAHLLTFIAAAERAITKAKGE